MITKRINSGWRMTRLSTGESYRAEVPCSVYSVLLRNGAMDDPFYRDNEPEALRLMDEDYEFSTVFSPDNEILSCEDIILRFDMLDTVADVYLNDILLGSPCSMHRTWEFHIKDDLKESNHLRVVIHSPTRYIKKRFAQDPILGSEDAMTGFPHIRKAHYMFGWDWGARLPDMGIHRDVTLLGVNKARLTGVYVQQAHSAGKVSLSVNAKAALSGMDNEFDVNNSDTFSLKIAFTDPDGNTLFSGDCNSSVEINKPRLWWPNGYGEQPLYTVRAELMYGGKEVDVWEKRIGLRTMEVSRQKDEYGEEFAHKVNGVKIFAMGADYIPQDNILSRVTYESTRALLEQCVSAHFNVIRVWGGGYYPEDFFYDICDELGLVVWQDFMFACAVYRLSDAFEQNIRAELIDNIRRLRHHPSLGLWCGNNEMEMFAGEGAWGAKYTLKSDYVKMYEYIFPKILADEDPQTFYWPASPSSGGGFDRPNDPDRGDVHYWEVWHGNKPFTEYRKYYFRYLSEFGFQSFPSVKTIEKFTLPEDRNIFSYVMEKHQRNASANSKIMSYMGQTFLYPESLDTLVYYSQLLQAEAIRYGVEHFRRHRGRCMGTVYWQLNDCWPVASWSSIDYYGRWKALHYYAKRFYAPLLISCEEEGTLGQLDNINTEPFELKKSIRLCVSNETMQEHKVTVSRQLRNRLGEVLNEKTQALIVPPQSSVWLDKEDMSAAKTYENYVIYQLEENGETVSEGTVLFCAPKHFKFADPRLEISVNGNEITVTSSAYAKSVCISNESDDLILSDNYFDMSPGSKTVRVIKGEPSGLSVRSVFI